MTTKPHIHVIRQEQFPASPVEDFCEEISPELNVETIERPEPGPFAALEWFIPTALIVYLARPYFDGFLGEAGKDHYHKLKNAVSRLGKTYTLGSQMAQRYVASEGKVDSEIPEYSLTFSVIAYVEPHLNFKLLIRSGADEEEVESAVSRFLNTVHRLHSGQYEQGEILGIEGIRPYSETIVIAYDSTADQLLALDPLKRAK